MRRALSLHHALSSTTRSAIASSKLTQRVVFARSFAVEIEKVPSLGDSITEGTVTSWQKAVGEWVNQDDVLATIETDKVSVDIRASKSGLLVAQKVKASETIKVGTELAEIDTSAAKPAGGAAAPKPAAEAPKSAAPAAAPTAAPATPAPAPTTPAPAAAAPKPEAKSEKPAKPQGTNPVFSIKGTVTRNERVVPASRLRMTVANRLKTAQNTAAMLTTFNEIDMTNLMELRNKYKDEFAEKHGVKLGFMSAFVKAATNALQKQPDVNAWLDGNNIIYRDYVDISVAVASPTGLLVPVLRNTENMTFAGVEAAIAALGAKARAGKISMEDITGGTFTISNGGVFGSLFGTPILNPPQSAILGMHGIFKRPVAIGDKVEVRPMMYVALTYDHRIIDGQGAVTFLKDIKATIEDPSRLILDL